MKKISKAVVTAGLGIAVLAVLAALACGRGGMMMDDDQMMQQMRSNPQMMRQMMEQMRQDPQMMQQMMEQMHSDPRMMQQMTDWMLKNPEHCERMAEHMAKNPEACRNMMQAMAKQMDSVSAEQMMQHCQAMMNRSGNASPAATTDVSGAGAQEATVNVTGSGFSPDAINVKKGVPVRIHFQRDDQPTCADEVVFADLNVRKKLPPNETTTVEITPAKQGTLTFACGMDMLRGKLVVQ